MKGISEYLKQIRNTFILWIVMIFYYMVEPALESSVQFIVPWTFMNGLIYQYNRREKTEVAVNGEK